MDKQQAGQVITTARFTKDKTWKDLADCMDAPIAWSTAALLGQHPLSAAQAEAVCDLLELDEEVAIALQLPPYRGSGRQEVPTDPTIYRLYEALSVYGPALKELVYEEFGDGIMSAINFRVDVERVPAEEGDRVRIVLDGKFLPYAW